MASLTLTQRLHTCGAIGREIVRASLLSEYEDIHSRDLSDHRFQTKLARLDTVAREVALSDALPSGAGSPDDDELRRHFLRDE